MPPTEPAATRFGSLARHRLVTTVEAAGFWGSIAFPPSYALALLFDPTPVTIAALIGLNVACLLVGHRHQPQIDTAILASDVATTSQEGDD